ncbi:MAG TPA: phosphate ABC transporter substrate-binding protein [Dehalococcoidia bacterium]
MRFFVPVLLGAFLLLSLLDAACSTGGGAGAATSIQVKGSDTMVNLGGAWAEAFMARRPDVSVAVTGGGSGTGIAALANGTTDIAQSSRAISQEERQKIAAAAGAEVREFVAGLDGVAVVVNPANPVDVLTLQQLSDIYSGRIRNWRDVGGRDQAMVVIARDTNSGTHEFFKEHVVRFRDPSLEYGPNVMFLAASEAGVEEVASNPRAIAFVGLGYAARRDDLKVLRIRQDADAPAVLPTAETVRSGQYSIARPLYLYTVGEPQGVVKEYIDWILGPEGQEIVRELDFIPVGQE